MRFTVILIRKKLFFMQITDPIAERLIKKLNEIKEEMDKIPDKARLRQMGSAYYHHIPEIVEILLSDRDAVKLIVTGSRGTRYEAFVESLLQEILQISEMRQRNPKKIISMESKKKLLPF